MPPVRRSAKRDAMLSLLKGTRCHPSADWVYHQLRPQYPDLSLGTVYRNLNQLCEQGAIRRIGTVNGQERYDGELSPHAHFICNHCGAVVDLPEHLPGQDYMEAVSVQYGFQTEGCEFIVRGLCKDCKTQNLDIGGNQT